MKQPKVFISYSWHPESNKIKVREIAERLTRDGVFVCFDEWDLKEGQDKYEFMERLVNDTSVDKVLLMCNKDYAEKANRRSGGVGTECTIVSSEVYSNATQTKFIPIVMQRDDSGKEYVPTFISSRIYIDLSNDETFEQEYEKLLRVLYDKPVSVRPSLGKMPAYLDSESRVSLRTVGKARRIKDAVLSGNANVDILIADYIDSFIDALPGYIIDYQTLTNDTFIDKIEEGIASLEELKADYLSFLKSIVNSKQFLNGTLMVNFFERLLQFYSDREINLYTGDGMDSIARDNFRLFNQDLFISIVALLIKYERFDVLHEILSARFVVTRSSWCRNVEDFNFVCFREYNYTLNEHKNKRLSMNRVSVTADVIKQYATFVSFDEMILADILLCYMSLMYPGGSIVHDHWYPELSCYTRSVEVLPKLMSKRYFDKAKILFDVNTVEEYRKKIDGLKDEIQRDGYFRIPNIKAGLSYDSVGSIS